MYLCEKCWPSMRDKWDFEYVHKKSTGCGICLMPALCGDEYDYDNIEDNNWVEDDEELDEDGNCTCSDCVSSREEAERIRQTSVTAEAPDWNFQWLNSAADVRS